MSAETLTTTIKQRAMELGFEKVALLPPAHLHEAEAHLQRWLDVGLNADLSWMKNNMEKRLNPALLMEDTQSIVMVALNYYQSDPLNSGDFKIAKYALGEDYHLVIKQKLNALLKELQTLDANIQGRAFVDSAPILEKALANRAGFGWQGKHSNLISRDYGSWLFLGELLLNIPLIYDEITPSANYCGSCTRCIEACPTQAIIADKIVDTNRCIAYWTIESKVETFPEAITNNLNGWVFGCDICQDVCPWNKKSAQITKQVSFLDRSGITKLKTKDILLLNNAQFKKLSLKTPFYRTGLKQLKRNINMTDILHDKKTSLLTDKVNSEVSVDGEDKIEPDN